jgi:quercetin dioxygenase-like cupin family protein
VIIRKPLLSAAVDGGKLTDHVEVKEINFAPGQETGSHRHPCLLVGDVGRRDDFFQVDGEPAKTLQQGDAFLEPANRKMLHFDNTSQTAPAKFIAFYPLGAGETS